MTPNEAEANCLLYEADPEYALSLGIPIPMPPVSDLALFRRAQEEAFRSMPKIGPNVVIQGCTFVPAGVGMLVSGGNVTITGCRSMQTLPGTLAGLGAILGGGLAGYRGKK